MKIGPRSYLLGIVLALYNAAAFVALNFIMWRNHLWNERKWTSTLTI